MVNTTETRGSSPYAIVVVLVLAALVLVGVAVAMAGSPGPADLDPASQGGPSSGGATPGPGTDAATAPDTDDDGQPTAPSDPPASGPAAGAGDASAPSDASRGDPSATDTRAPLTIHHVGDVNLDRGQMGSPFTTDPASVWDGVRETFTQADLVLANLECAATDGGAPLDKQYVFRCDLDALPAMRASGVDVVSLANNHSGDYGVPGMVDGLRNVEAAGITGVGVGADEDEAYRPRMVEVAGWRVAVLGFGGVVPTPDWTARGSRPGQATGYDAARMAAAVEAAAEDADLVVVTVHWGDEGALEPRDEDRVKAEAVLAAGADVVFGHHAHRLQPLERVDGAPVFWNLGNFVWPSLSAEASRTAVASVTFEPDGPARACLLPFRIAPGGVPAPTGDAPTCR